MRSPGLVGRDRGHKHTEVRKDESAEQSEEGHKQQKESWTLVCVTRSPSFWLTTQASPNTGSRRTIWDVRVLWCASGSDLSLIVILNRITFDVKKVWTWEMHTQSVRSYEMNGEAWVRTQFQNTLRFWLASGHLPGLLLLIVCFSDATLGTQRPGQTCKTSRLSGSLTTHRT